MSKPITDIDDVRLVKALAHPIRVRIIGILEQRVASPKQMSLELRVPIENLSYHIRLLRKLGMIRLVRTRQVRGTIEHFYESVGRPTIDAEAWERLPNIVREALLTAGLGQMFSIISAAAEQGMLDNPECQIRRMSYMLDGRGFSEASALVTDLVDGLIKVEKRAKTRLRAEHEAEYPTTFIGFLFGTPDMKAAAGHGAQPSADAEAAAERSKQSLADVAPSGE